MGQQTVGDTPNSESGACRSGSCALLARRFNPFGVVAHNCNILYIQYRVTPIHSPDLSPIKHLPEIIECISRRGERASQDQSTRLHIHSQQPSVFSVNLQSYFLPASRYADNDIQRYSCPDWARPRAAGPPLRVVPALRPHIRSDLIRSAPEATSGYDSRGCRLLKGTRRRPPPPKTPSLTHADTRLLSPECRTRPQHLLDSPSHSSDLSNRYLPRSMGRYGSCGLPDGCPHPGTALV